MAAGRIFTCPVCTQRYEAWDEGHPYLRDPLTRRKQYYYHPDPRRMLCEGCDVPHLCLDCGKEFKVDSEKPRSSCPKCRSRLIMQLWDLEGQRCPHCKQGQFIEDGYMIS